MPGRYFASLDRTSLLEFTNRQILITRVYAPKRWGMGMAAHLGYVITLVFAAIVIVMQMADGDPWMNLRWSPSWCRFLAVIKGVLRTIAVDEMLPEWKAQLGQWSWVWTVLAPVVPFLFAWNFLSSLALPPHALAQRSLRARIPQHHPRPQPLADSFSASP